MSHVYVARDEALGRDVVIKILMPELAATLNVERFTREIRLVAKLQQANIVPVVQPFDDPVPANAPKLDLITLIMNYHDIAYMPVDRAKMNQRLFNALKPGGHLVVLDHSAKAGSGISAAKTLHRIDEKVVVDEFQQAGFKLEQEGDFLRNPDDPRDQAFFNMKIPTDKFALRFVKP